jgi:hypothetical protein
MPRWEYRLLLVYTNSAGVGSVQQIDGVNVVPGARLSTVDALGQAGEAGWELVGVKGGEPWSTLYLKRPKRR